MGVSKSRAQDAAKARLSADIVGYALGVSGADIMAAEKGAPETAFARQVAMYLCYIAFEISLARVASAFARDRSTVSHACHRIEDRRDEPQFDRWIESLEAMARCAPLGAAQGAP
ncbi:MAG: chromosomal replication initiator DnaA [Proteobacteria bacterium]|nr:chromosomal replication initiator DnaA [Pseudomonadota bacterium]